MITLVNGNVAARCNCSLYPQGMFRARGKLLLFADADGATTFSEYGRVETSLKSACKGLGDSMAIRFRFLLVLETFL